MARDFDDSDDDVTLDVELVAETDRAIRVRVDGDEEWIPLSQVRDRDVHERGDVGTITIPRWLAADRGWE